MESLFDPANVSTPPAGKAKPKRRRRAKPSRLTCPQCNAELCVFYRGRAECVRCGTVTPLADLLASNCGSLGDGAGKGGGLYSWGVDAVYRYCRLATFLD